MLHAGKSLGRTARGGIKYQVAWEDGIEAWHTAADFVSLQSRAFVALGGRRLLVDKQHGIQFYAERAVGEEKEVVDPAPAVAAGDEAVVDSKPTVDAESDGVDDGPVRGPTDPTTFGVNDDGDAADDAPDSDPADPDVMELDVDSDGLDDAVDLETGVDTPRASTNSRARAHSLSCMHIHFDTCTTSGRTRVHNSL